VKSVLPLRGSDLTGLEVQLPELVRKPLNQIALVNVMDILELAGTEGRPKGLDRALQGFVASIGRHVTDIPKGRSWELFLDELDELEGKQVPHVFREMLAREAEQPERAAPRVNALLERWAEQPPTPFPLSTRTTRIQRAELVIPKGPSTEPPSAPRERSERSRSPRGEKAPRTPAAPRPKPTMDIERRDFVIDQCMERLARSPEKGLAELVLVAGVKHAALGQYPDLAPVEITTVLKQLKEANRVRFSAGRWTLVTRF
jgi:hypothetical protein